MATEAVILAMAEQRRIVPLRKGAVESPSVEHVSSLINLIRGRTRRTCPNFELLIERELNGDVSDAE